MTKFFVCKFSKILSPCYTYWEFTDKRANSVDLDEVAHNEPSHQDLHCLQIQVLSSLVLKKLRQKYSKSAKNWADNVYQDQTAPVQQGLHCIPFYWSTSTYHIQ